MAKQKFGLGRGLDALISGASEVMAPQSQPLPPDSDTGSLPLVPIESIIPNPRQPRKVFRDDDPKLLELSSSIKEHGLLQPIVVTRLDLPEKHDGTGDAWFDDTNEAKAGGEKGVVKFQIIAGERRWRASKKAGLTQVPVLIKEVTPQQMLELALIENIQRSDLNPIEEALAYQALIQDYNLTQEQVARQVGKDRSTVTNSLRLLQLAPKLRDALINQPENFTEGHARALGGITREEDQVTAMNQVIALHLNVRQTEELATRIKASRDIESAIQRATPPSKRSPEQETLESQFRDALMVKVDLKYNAKGKGTIVLHFNDQDELESLYARLVKKTDE
ncbi:ParB/RepB/Spo0J family partition protein [Ktedonospora formicarum]|uniref:Chromosome partitioning protein ParB n=1 Tax=Ktedonospora formicarum TaxID=2778364 RepID=A0A8J3MPM0_9CHLR|nr:ParB/RepB/Spo0J family partition protein [Ktedonospora formicarum]GHO43962.1 chromosome partitioning protein ParB [Ktedonospora formicarum]